MSARKTASVVDTLLCLARIVPLIVPNHLQLNCRIFLQWFVFLLLLLFLPVSNNLEEEIIIATSGFFPDLQNLHFHWILVFFGRLYSNFLQTLQLSFAGRMEGVSMVGLLQAGLHPGPWHLCLLKSTKLQEVMLYLLLSSWIRLHLIRNFQDSWRIRTLWKFAPTGFGSSENTICSSWLL